MALSDRSDTETLDVARIWETLTALLSETGRAAIRRAAAKLDREAASGSDDADVARAAAAELRRLATALGEAVE